MTNNNSPDNWVPVHQSQTATSGDDSPWVKVDTDHQGKTSWDSFETSKSPDASNEDQKVQVPEPKESKEKIDPNTRKTVQSPDYPPENWLNATVHSAEGAAWDTFVKPFSKPQPDMDEYLNQLQKKHPIASVVGGIAPFIAAAPFVPESLAPNVYLRTVAQFGLVGLGVGINRAKAEDPSTALPQKISDVAQETLKQMSYGPIYAKAQALQILDRPFVAALSRAGVIGVGNGALSKVYGDNITEAFKQAGLYGGLSLMTELPHLATTTIGRGIAAHINDLRSKAVVKTGWPIIDPESPDVASHIHDAAHAIAKQVPGIDKPQIASATVKLNDGTQIHGTSHEDALEKIGKSKENMTEGKDFTAGFTVVDPDGKSRFMTREESKQPPFNLRNGESEDVKGLNESKFLKPKERIKIVNPETLERMSGTYSETDQNKYVKNDPLEISFGKDDSSTADKIRQEFSGVKNEQIVRGNQLADEIKRLVPDKSEREALFWYKAAQGNNDHLLEMLSEDSMKPYADSVKKSFSLGPKAMEALDKINQYYEESGKVAMELGTIRNVRENYMNRIYKPEPKEDYVKTETRGTATKRTTKHAKARVYENELDAVMGGKQFATTDIADALSIHNEEMARVNTNRRLADAMVDSGLGAWNKQEHIPEGWEQVGNISKSVPIKNDKGEPVVGEDGNQVISRSVFVAPKGISKGLAAIMEPNFVSRIDSLRAIQKYQGLVKTVDLSLSFFHHFTMAAQVLYQGGVRTFMKLPVMDKMIKSDSFAEMERDLAKHGGMTSKVEANQDVLRSLMENDSGLMSKLGKLPVVKQYFELTEKSSNFLFGRIQRYLKVMDYGDKISKWVAKHPEAENEEVKLAKQGLAKEVNAAYGGLNWEAMGMTRSNLSLLRLGLLAPDWTVSNYELLKYAVGDWGKTATAGEQSRKHILTALVGGIVLTEGFNQLLTGHTTDKNKKGHALEIEISPNVYVSLLRGGIGDITKLASMLSESGAGGVARFSQGKLSPLARFGLGALEGEQYTGRPITKKDSGPVRATYDYLAYAASNLLPVPFGIGNLGQYMNDPQKTFVGGAALSTGVARYSKSKKDSENEMTPYKEKEKERDEKLTPLQRKTKHMSFKQVDELYQSASDDEKEELKDILENKMERKKKIRNWSEEDEALYTNTL